MLADEMTTGSVTTSDADKRTFAARSHAWNLEQKRFREAFPDVRSISLFNNLSILHRRTSSRRGLARPFYLCLHLRPSRPTLPISIHSRTAPVN